MRTLKKTLCLVLCIAMMAGLCMISTSAAFTDADEIVYTEAVEVLSGLGVLNGIEQADGTFKFDPKGTLTREQAAKIIVYIMAMDDIKAESPFTDCKGRWSEASIAVCAAEGIVNGVTADTFNPTGVLTGNMFAKMLLGALGFDAVENGMTGTSWEIGVAKLLKTTKLADNIEDYDGTANMTREEACQMAFDALLYTGEAGELEYTVTAEDGTVLYKGNDALTATLMRSTNEDSKLTSAATYKDALAGNFDLQKITVTDEYGRTSVVYNNSKDAKAKGYVEYAKFPATPVLTYTAGVTYGKLAADLGCTKVADTVTLTEIRNGEANEPFDIDKTMTDYNLSYQGELVEIYKTGTKAYTAIIIDTYYQVMTKDNIVAAKKATATTDAEAAYVLLGGGEYETDEFKVGDVVLYTWYYAPDYTIKSAAKAASFTGTVTAVYEDESESCYESSYVKIDGQKYGISFNHYTCVYEYEIGKEYTFYTDLYGYLVYAEEGKAAEVETNVTVVTGIAFSVKNNVVAGDDLFSGTDNITITYQAKVVDLETGALKVVNIGMVKGTDGKYYRADKTGAPTGEPYNYTGDETFTETRLCDLVEYAALEDGSYAFVDSAETTEVTLKKGVAKIADGLFATSSTELKVVELTFNKNGEVTAAKITKTTGIANFPAAETVYENAVVTAKNGAVSSILVVKEAEAAATVANYAVYKGAGETDKTGTKAAFYVDGAEVEYYVADEVSLTEGGVYDITVVSGKVTKAEAVEADKTELEVTAVDETFFVAGDEIYYYAKSCVVLDSAADYAKGEVAVGDVVDITVNAKDEVIFVLK